MPSAEDLLQATKTAIEEKYFLKEETAFCLWGVGIGAKNGKSAIAVILPHRTSPEDKLRIETGLEEEFRVPITGHVF